MHTDKNKMKKEVENRLAEVMWRSKKREKGRQTRSKEQQRAHVREERGPMMKSQHSRAGVASESRPLGAFILMHKNQ